MKKFFFFAFMLASLFSYSQKKYDCIVVTKYEGDNTDSFWKHRTVGALKLINDSSILLHSKNIDTIFNWRDLKTVKFRKHNGFSRTVIPIMLLFAGAAAADADISFKNSQHSGGCGCVSSVATNPTIIIFPAVFVMTFPIAVPIYFITRNHSFRINSYVDFAKLKKASSKYILK